MKKKLLRVCLVSLFVLAMLAVCMKPFWVDAVTRSKMDENGVVHICSERDLRYFMEYLEHGNKTTDAVLDADIDLQETWSSVSNYAGHFNGQGHTILHQKLFIWDKLESGAVVENLNLQDVDIKSFRAGAGGIAYRNYGEIRNCQVSGRIEGLNYAGGIVSGNFGLITDCINYADIISTETGETYEQKYHYDGYGAGGIAGVSGTSRSENKKYQAKKSAILNCENYGSVTAFTLAGGICAYVEDRTNESAANLSVQELVETTDFGVYEPEDSNSYEEKEEKVKTAEIADKNGVKIEKDLVNGMHYSIIGCKNYGTVMAEQVVDIHESYTRAAGICAYLHYGDLYHCANLGNVRISEEAPKVSDTGWVYANKPYAITKTMGLSPSIHHVVDCVNLKGTMPGTMWNESVMEVTEDELELWEQGELPYVSNNWQFQLEEAVRVCSLEPLCVEEDASSAGWENIYRCEDFVLSLPKGFVVEEEYLGDTCYALHVTIEEGALQKLPESLQGQETADFEVWILRKEADVSKAYTEVAETVNRWQGFEYKYFIEEIYQTIPNYWFLEIGAINLPFHKGVSEKDLGGKRIFMESGLPVTQLYSYQREGDHVLGNYLSMPLEGNREEGLKARWIFLFTNRETNIHPERSYMDAIEQGFYPLDGSENLIEIQKGDTLSSLAKNHLGDSGDWRLLADINGLEEPNLLFAGDFLLIPDKEAYEKKPAYIDNGWFPEEEKETEESADSESLCSD